MLLAEDVADDLVWAYPDYYRRDGGELLVYQNGADNPEYKVIVQVVPL